MIHIGNLIEERFRDLGLSKSELARKINTSRENIYGIISRETIDTGLLYKISEALKFDFFQFYKLENVDRPNQKQVEDYEKVIQKMVDQRERLERIIDTHLESLRLHNNIIQEKDKEITELKKRINELEKKPG